MSTNGCYIAYFKGNESGASQGLSVCNVFSNTNVFTTTAT